MRLGYVEWVSRGERSPDRKYDFERQEHHGASQISYFVSYIQVLSMHGFGLLSRRCVLRGICRLIQYSYQPNADIAHRPNESTLPDYSSRHVSHQSISYAEYWKDTTKHCD